MDHEGYNIQKDKDGTFRVTVGDKVTHVGLQSEIDAKTAIKVRRQRRENMGLKAVG